jgi:hypothetical protein
MLRGDGSRAVLELIHWVAFIAQYVFLARHADAF